MLGGRTESVSERYAKVRPTTQTGLFQPDPQAGAPRATRFSPALGVIRRRRIDVHTTPPRSLIAVENRVVRSLGFQTAPNGRGAQALIESVTHQFLRWVSGRRVMQSIQPLERRTFLSSTLTVPEPYVIAVVHVINDVNGDGIQESNEPGLAGWPWHRMGRSATPVRPIRPAPITARTSCRST